MKITIHNLNEATEQQVFDTISTHLLTQKSKSEMYAPYTCAYRSGEGKACAVGCLIPIEDYKPEYERNKWTQLISKYEYLPHRHSSFLSRLQRIHDSIEPRDWPTALRSLAKSHYLEINQEFTNLEQESREFFTRNLS